MILTLEVMGEQAGSLGGESCKVFDSIGGTIGRLPDNDWVFPDPYISGRHALIRYLNGKFFIEDTSTNGVCVNSPDNRLSRAQPYQLKDGDLLYIDAYRIQVSIEQPSRSKAKEVDPFELLKARAFEVQAEKTIALSTPDEDHTESMVRDAGAAPAAKRAGRATTAAPKGGARPGADDELLRTTLAAAGIEGVEPSSQLAQTLGEVLRAAVFGLMEALRARERTKDEMHMRATSFKAQDNNPLKFSANVADAFHNLLVKRNPAYLTPPEAFEDALRDLRDHQAAMVAAMRIAFEATLAQFDPERLQEDFDRQIKKGSILGVPAKLRYWDLYRDKYAELAKDANASFHALFGQEFAKAYADQLVQLSAVARHRPK